MEFQIDRSEFLAALTQAETVADRRGASQPILANVLLRANHGYVACSATDTMIALTETIPADVESLGSLTLDARHLRGVVKSLPTGKIRFRELADQVAQLVLGKNEFKLKATLETDFPDLPKHEREVFTTIDGRSLAELIDKTGFSASTDEARVNLNGVLLECDGSTAMMVSTDGHRLTKYARALEGPVLPKGVIIPRKGMLEIRRVLERHSGEVEIAIRAEQFFLRAGRLILWVKLSNTTFPPYNHVIPKKHKREARVKRGDLLTALQRSEVMAPEKSANVRMLLSDGALELTADDPGLGTALHEIAADLQGEGIYCSFNARYLMAALEVMDSETVRLQFQGELDPCVMRPGDESDFLALVMPMRI